MPKDFMDCIKNKGKVVRKKLKGGKYILICYDKNGKAYPGKVKTKNKKTTSGWHNKSKKKSTGFENEKAQVKDLLTLKNYFDKKYHN